jgi:hypothetical protein
MSKMIRSTMNLEIPDDFPVELYDEVYNKVQAKAGSWESMPDFRNQYVPAWTALAYRFRACAEYDEEFTNSIQQNGIAPPQPERYNQERALFGFFVNGLSTIETFSYGLYTIAYIIKPQTFLIHTDDQLRAIKLHKTYQDFNNEFLDEPITISLRTLTESGEYREWQEFRNVLAHRGQPGRSISITIGSEQNVSLWKLKDLILNHSTTAQKRKWLSDTIHDLLINTKAFCEKYF